MTSQTKNRLLYEQAVSHYHKKEYNTALDICQACIDKGEAGSDLFYLIGTIFKENQLYEKAAYYLHRAILTDPEKALYHMQLGLVYQQNACMDEAIICFKKTLEKRPDYADAYANIGNAMVTKGYLQDALVWFQKATEVNPENYDACYNLGLILQTTGDLEKSENLFQQCLKKRPEDVQVLNNLGIIYQRLNKFESAIEFYERGIAIKPDYFEAYNNLATLYGDIGKESEAIGKLRKCVSLVPENEAILSNLVDRLTYACDWNELNTHGALLEKITATALEKKIKPVEPPFSSIIHQDNPKRSLAIAKSYAQSIARDMTTSQQNIQNFSFDRQQKKNKRLRLGYVSNDLGDHAVGHILCPLFENHDRKRFEIIVYSYGKTDQSQFDKKIRNDCDQFIDISTLNLIESAERIFNDQIDILIDLKGYTRSNRMGIFALKPAPVQVSYLGFLGTSGARFMDYILADPIVIPQEHRPHYTEKVIWLPCYQVTNYSQFAPTKTMQRKEFGLPEQGFVLCSFNQPYKFDPIMFTVWMNIMKKIPNSILWLKKPSDIAAKNLQREAESRGVDKKRLIFTPGTSLGNHLERLRLADLALDTRVYNGGATTSNALWAGVPVVTLQGRQFVARMSSSSLSAIGVPELISHSLDDYEALCVRLATDKEHLNRIKQKIVENRDTSLLFDMKKFTTGLESAFQEMWNLHIAEEQTPKKP